MLYDGNPNYYPLLCIGKNINLKCGCIDRLFVSPSGRIAIAIDNPFGKGVSQASLSDFFSTAIDELRSWTFDDLDGVAANYFYERDGQAARGIDIMARDGYLTFTSKEMFDKNVTSGLQHRDILVIFPVDKSELAMRTLDLSFGMIGKSGLLYSILDQDAYKAITK